MQNKILLTGGSGRLGTELQKYYNKKYCYAPSEKEIDIQNVYVLENINMILHCAGYTDVAKAEKEIQKCFMINTIGTKNLAKHNSQIPFVYISTEYAENPTNWYGRTKLEGEKMVEKFCDNYLIIRTLFKPRPFPFRYAFSDQYTQGDYIDIITPLIISEIEQWDKEGQRLVYVGTGRKTIYELAKQTRPDVRPNSVNDIKEVKLPKDYV